MTLHLPILVLVAATAAAGAAAQNLPGNSNPNGFVSQLLGGYALFAANDQSLGMELWRLDHGTQAVTLVRDIANGPPGSDPRELTAFQGTYVFAAYSRNDGIELWRSDGTPSGTQQAANIHPTASSKPHRLTVAGTRVFFVADDGASGRELWSYDGVATALVADIRPGGDADPRDLVALGGIVLFTADDGVNGRELWRSDGTLAGTQLVRDIRVGPTGSGAHGFAAAAGFVLFAADDGASGMELWRSDGTTAGTLLVRDIEPGSGGSAPADLHWQASTFFAASTTTSGRELWMSDGTSAGTTMVADVNPGPAGSDPRDLISVNFFDFWFVADDGNGRELWRCLINGTGLVRKTNLVAGVGNIGPRNLVYTGAPDRVVFSDASGDPRLWGTDASAAGASVLAPFHLGPNALTSVRGALALNSVLFAADDGTTGLEPWRTDGTPAGTSLLANIAPDVGGSSPNLDAHVNTGGSLVTICIEDGPPLGLGILGYSSAPGPAITGLGIFNGPILLSLPTLATFVLALDGTGTACMTITVPSSLTNADLVAQGFTIDPLTGLPFSVTDLATIGITSAATVTLFGGTTKTVGVFSDEDHRYEVSVQLPPLPGSGAHPSGTFVFRHRFSYGGDETLVELGEQHQYPYDGKSTTLFFSGQTPLVKNAGLELWFLDDDGGETFVWRSYC